MTIPEDSNDPTGSPAASSVGSFEDWGDEDEEELRAVLSEQQQLDAIAGGRARAARTHSNRIRWLKLGLACCMSIGSHYGSYVLGPVKNKLHTSETSFAALVSSFQLVNTITPLVTGAAIQRYSAAIVGLGATGAVLLGQVIVVFAQRHGTEGDQTFHGMILGLFCFGLGLSPIAIVQESIILRNNGSASKSVARSVAVGLLFGKTSAFVAALSAEPLAALSPRLPFIVACSLALLSFSACVAYNWLERHESHTTNQGHSEGHHSKSLELAASARYGTAFWQYILVCTLAGAWYTTIHQSSALIQAMYGETEARAAPAASVILFSSTLLYPIIGTVVDYRPHILSKMYYAVPSSIAVTFVILRYMTNVVPYWLSALPAAIGVGAGPLLLVIVVPKIVERHQVPTALAWHKSLEMAGAVLLQTATGVLLSGDSPAFDRFGVVCQLLLFIFFVQLAVIVVWWRNIHRRELEAENEALEYGLLPTGADDERGDERATDRRTLQGSTTKGSRSPEETRIGTLALKTSIGVVALAWLAFGLTLVY